MEIKDIIARKKNSGGSFMVEMPALPIKLPVVRQFAMDIWREEGQKIIREAISQFNALANGKIATMKALAKGDPGITPTKQELIDLLKPFIPGKPADGVTPSREYLLKLIKPLVQEPQKYTTEEIKTLINSLLPKQKLGKKIEKKSQFTMSDVIGLDEQMQKLWTALTQRIRQAQPYLHGGGSSSSVSSGFQAPTSGVVDGSNATFVFATAPNVIVVDQGRAMQKVSSDGTVNWTGTTTVVLTVAPNSDIYATA